MRKFLVVLIAVLHGVQGKRLLQLLENEFCSNKSISCPTNTNQHINPTSDDWNFAFSADNLQRPVKTQSCSFSSYSALGDSYSVGLGSLARLEMCPTNTTIGSNTCTTGHCWKDIGAYGYRFAKQFNIPVFNYLACSGANTTEIHYTQLNSSYFNTSGNTPPALVSLSGGGDDYHLFADIVVECALDPVFNNFACDLALANATTKLPRIYDNLKILYAAINQRIKTSSGPKTQVVVMGMPRPFGKSNFVGLNGVGGYCPEHPIPSSKAAINDIVIGLNAITKKATHAAGFLYVDSDPLWDTHRWCDTGVTWLNYNLCRKECDTDHKVYDSVAYAHPFYYGQDAFLRAMISTLGCTPTVGGVDIQELK